MRYSIFSRKGQEGATAAAALIAIITLLIVLYILVIPPSERDKILEGDDVEDNDIVDGNLTIFELESPKKFFPTSELEFEQNFPAINLYLQDEGTELKRVDNLFVEKSLVSEKKSTVNFEIINLDDAKNVLLNFVVKERQGRLIIKLNDNEIFNTQIEGINIEPVKLTEFLKQGVNTLEFGSSSPGLGFWRTNQYSLDDISITADIINRDSQDSSNIFLLTSSEKDNMEKIRLRFFAQCTVGVVGKLNIWINNHNLYSAVPDCGSANLPIDFSPSHLVTGENSLRFKTDRGKYLIEQLKLTANLKKVDPALYYFQLSSNQFESVRNKTSDIFLDLRFIDDEKVKEADITINGNKIRLDQTDIDYSKDISDLIERGNNVIKIDPEDPLDIVELIVQLET